MKYSKLIVTILSALFLGTIVCFFVSGNFNKMFLYEKNADEYLSKFRAVSKDTHGHYAPAGKTETGRLIFKDISNVENKRKNYNESAKAYNEFISKFPNNFLASFFSFNKKDSMLSDSVKIPTYIYY